MGERLHPLVDDRADQLAAADVASAGKLGEA